MGERGFMVSDESQRKPSFDGNSWNFGGGE
jgi:hypothetical protein